MRRWSVHRSWSAHRENSEKFTAAQKQMVAIHLGMAYQRTGQWQKTIHQLTDALDSLDAVGETDEIASAQRRLIYTNLGYALADAGKASAAALELDEQSAAAILDLAEFYRGQGRLVDGIALLQEVTEKHPEPGLLRLLRRFENERSGLTQQFEGAAAKSPPIVPH